MAYVKITDSTDNNDQSDILLEVILLPQRGLRLLVLMREISLEAGTEVNMPAPEPPEERLGVLVVVRAKLAV